MTKDQRDNQDWTDLVEEALGGNPLDPTSGRHRP